MRPHQQYLVFPRSLIVFLTLTVMFFCFSGSAARSYGAHVSAGNSLSRSMSSKKMKKEEKEKNRWMTLALHQINRPTSTSASMNKPKPGFSKNPLKEPPPMRDPLPQYPKPQEKSILLHHRTVPVKTAHGVPPLTPTPHMARGSNLRVPSGLDNIFKPRRIEKNMLSFVINPKVINGSSKPISSVKLYVYVWKRETKKRPNFVSTRDLSKRGRRRKARRNKSIRIRVFKSNKDGVKGKHIADLKKEINESKFQIIPLPISLIQNISEDPDENGGSIYLKVQCNRCSRKTRLILPGNDKKRCQKRKKSKSRRELDTDSMKAKIQGLIKLKRRSRRRRRRRYCAKMRSLETSKWQPFIVIYDDNLMPRIGRRKRSAGYPALCTTNSEYITKPDASNDSENYDNHVTTHNSSSPEARQCCDKLETFINFSELNPDTKIVSPSGFHYSTCSTTNCHINARPDLHKNLIQEELRRKIMSVISPSSPSIQTIKPNSNQKNKPVRISNILNRSRLKGELTHHVRTFNTSSCSPSSRRHLEFVFLDEDSSLVKAVLPDFIVTDCQCNKP